MSTTLITALYNIGRQELQGNYAYRPFDKYLQWFQHVLSINVPKIIHIDASLSSYVQGHNRYPNITSIVITPFEQLPAYRKYHDKIQQVIDHMRTETSPLPYHYQHCPEFITAKYPVCIFSKFDFLLQATKSNPYDSKYFIWLDAGTFYDIPPFDTSNLWPDPYKIQLLGDKFLVPNISFNPNKPIPDKITYLKSSTNEVCAYMLGGVKSAIEKVQQQIWERVDWALDNNVINNEQHFLQLLIREDPTSYFLWNRTKDNYPLLPRPLHDRMIPYELAQGTKMSYNYPIDPRVQLYAVSTIEVAPHTYERWKSSAIYHGFQPQVLCSNQIWKGFQVKIRGLYQGVKNCTSEYVVLTDTSDVYFQGSSTELCDKFINLNQDIIVGGEQIMYYPIATYDKQVVDDYFDSIKQGPQCYPNTGFVMGKTKSVLALLERIYDKHDDQAGIIDVFFEGKQPITIDYRTELIGNVPKYPGGFGNDYFVLNEKTKRQVSTLHGTSPIVLHFPGKNFSIMDQYYNQGLYLDSNEENNWYWLLIILGILIILLIVYLLI